MDRYFVASGQNEVFLRSNAPTASAIEAALRSVPLASGGEDAGSFVGSSRIVRRAYLSLTGGRVTTFAWLWKVSDDPTKPQTEAQNAARATNLAANLQAQISNVLNSQLNHAAWGTDWSNVTVTPYDATSNGTIQWWTNGDASHTPTRDEFPLAQQLGQTSQVDAPAGPTGARPNSIASALPNPIPLLPSTGDLKIFGGLALGILGLVYLGPAIKAMTGPKLRKVEYARRNPIGAVRASLLRKGERIVWHPSSEKAAAQFEGLLKIGESGVLLENGARGGVLYVRFDGGTVVQRLPISEAGVPSEMGYARPNPQANAIVFGSPAQAAKERMQVILEKEGLLDPALRWCATTPDSNNVTMMNIPPNVQSWFHTDAGEKAVRKAKLLLFMQSYQGGESLLVFTTRDRPAGWTRSHPALDATGRRNPSLDVANTILSQMGGAGRLKAMIGAKDFMGDAYSLTFKWAAPSQANALTVQLTTDDTYTMTFMKLRGRTVKVVRAVTDAHAEDLVRIFQIETGLALSL